MTATTKLDLELLQNGAANQTLANETFHQLNQIVQASIVDRLTTPPGSPANEALYLIVATATGAWAGKENQLAYWLTSTNAWQYIDPREGMFVHVNDENEYYTYDGSAWSIFSSGGATLPVVQALSSTRNLVLADINTFNVNSTTNNYTVTIQPQSSETWTADAEIHFLPSNTGDIIILGGTGVSVNGVSAGSFTLSTQYGAATIKRIASDSWWVGGVLGTLAEQRTALGLGSGDTAEFAAVTINTGPLLFTGTGGRTVRSPSTEANALYFESDTTNQNGNVFARPRGTATASGFISKNTSDATNYARMQFYIDPTGLFFSQSIAGSGAYVPMVFTTGGAARLTISTTGTLTALGVYNTTTASAANVFVDSAGLLQRSTSSEQYKQQIEPMEPRYAEAAYGLAPIWYRSKCENDNPDWGWWGFSAEQAATVDPRLVHWRTTEPVEIEGEPDNLGNPTTVVEHRPLDVPVAEGFAYERLTVHHNMLLTQHRDRIAALEAQLATLFELVGKS